MNPFYDAHETSLSSKNEHDWNVLRSHWMQFGGYSFCRKFGRKWTVEGFGFSPTHVQMSPAPFGAAFAVGTFFCFA